MKNILIASVLGLSLASTAFAANGPAEQKAPFSTHDQIIPTKKDDAKFGNEKKCNCLPGISKKKAPFSDKLAG